MSEEPNVRGKLDLLLLKFCLFEWILHPEIKDFVIIHLLSNPLKTFFC